MAKIIITMDIDDEFADPEHEMGVTEQGFLALDGLLARLGSVTSVRQEVQA